MTHRITCPVVASDLKDAAAAISFALDYLQPHEPFEFLNEWREGKDLAPWIEAWEYDQEEARRMTDPNWTPS